MGYWGLMAEPRTYRLSSEQDARTIVDELKSHGFEASLEHNGNWRVQVQVEPQTMGEAERLIMDLDQDATDVTS